MIVFGGESSEHEVSIVSARNIYQAINKQKYQISLAFIDKSGQWWSIDNSDDYAAPSIRLSISPGVPIFSTDNGHEIKPDVLFPVLHGRNGEDGSVQGLAQLMHLPIVGCDMTSSVLTMDKIAAKEILNQHGFDVLPFISHRTGTDMPDYRSVSYKLGSILFVKPSRAGSSVGVSMVKNEAEYRIAVDEAHRHDEFIIIEQAANKPRELEVAVLGTPPNHRASVVGEIKPEGVFYSYDSKYSADSTSAVIVPANIAIDLAENIRQQALDAYSVLKCRTMARVDFLYDENGLYINEINTIPGFTNISMYPKLWDHSGLTYDSLIDRLVELAE